MKGRLYTTVVHCGVEMCMGMGFQTGMGFPWECESKAYFNGNDFCGSENVKKHIVQKFPPLSVSVQMDPLSISK